MSGPVPDGSKSVVPFGAKSKNVASNVADPLEAAGQTILGLVHRAASTAEKNYQQALDFTQKLSDHPGGRRSVSGGQGRSCGEMAVQNLRLTGMIVSACKYLLRRPKAREDSCSDGEQSVPPRSAPWSVPPRDPSKAVRIASAP
jgi:hypothetical protein